MKAQQAIPMWLPCPHCKGRARIPNPTYQGNKMREMRQKAGLGLREIARELGFSAGYVSDLELGRRGWSDLLVLNYEAATVKLSAGR